MNRIPISIVVLSIMMIMLMISMERELVAARVRDLCQVKPTTSVLCSPTTVGIYYDMESQKCHFMGCNNKKLFTSVEDCEKICNNDRHKRMRQSHDFKVSIIDYAP